MGKRKEAGGGRARLSAKQGRALVEQWRQSVEQRLAQLDQLYSVVQGEVNERRMLWLEFIIVVLFVIDLIALIFLPK